MPHTTRLDEGMAVRREVLGAEHGVDLDAVE
jgi:hypothetical protein